MGSRIDYILHAAHLASVEAVIDRTNLADGRFPSDHYAVTVTLEARQ